MSTNINNMQTVNPQPSQSTVTTSSDVNEVSGSNEVRESTATKHTTPVDGYGVVQQGVRSNVLSSQPPVPTDAETTGPNALRSATSKVSYLGEGSSLGNQVLTLGAENPNSNIDTLIRPQHRLLTSSTFAPASGHASTSAAATSSASSTTTDTATNAKATASTATTAPTSKDPAADTAEATKHSDKWYNGVHCHHDDQDKDIAKETGLSSATATQAYQLMGRRDDKEGLAKNNTTDDRQTIGVALAVLAQEKKEGSKSYAADKKTITDALKILRDNADNRSGGVDAQKHIKAYEGALAALSKVTTNRLGTDPAGAPRGSTSAGDKFDSTKSPAVVNSWG